MGVNCLGLKNAHAAFESLDECSHCSHLFLKVLWLACQKNLFCKDPILASTDGARRVNGSYCWSRTELRAQLDFIDLLPYASTSPGLTVGLLNCLDDDLVHCIAQDPLACTPARWDAAHYLQEFSFLLEKRGINVICSEVSQSGFYSKGGCGMCAVLDRRGLNRHLTFTSLLCFLCMGDWLHWLVHQSQSCLLLYPNISSQNNRENVSYLPFCWYIMSI